MVSWHCRRARTRRAGGASRRKVMTSRSSGRSAGRQPGPRAERLARPTGPVRRRPPSASRAASSTARGSSPRTIAVAQRWTMPWWARRSRTVQPGHVGTGASSPARRPHHEPVGGRLDGVDVLGDGGRPYVMQGSRPAAAASARRGGSAGAVAARLTARAPAGPAGSRPRRARARAGAARPPGESDGWSGPDERPTARAPASDREARPAKRTGWALGRSGASPPEPPRQQPWRRPDPNAAYVHRLLSSKPAVWSL